MNATQALEITVNAIRVDSALTGQPVNLNRVTFWLSELHYGRKHMGETLSMAGTRDIVRTAANIATLHTGAVKLVTLASN